MLIIRGCAAFSDFRINKTLSSLQQLCPEITSIHAHYLHFIQTGETLTDNESERLRDLLNYGFTVPANASVTPSLLVIPRPGTISPWSSKATDIARNCGLHNVLRVERGIAWHIESTINFKVDEIIFQRIRDVLHDRMTQVVLENIDDAELLFTENKPGALSFIPLLADGKPALESANQTMGLALSDEEINYLFDAFTGLQRDPSDVELMMFAQANSEHCRHKIFNADWQINGIKEPASLFDMIRETHRHHPGRVLSAYKDNAAVMQGYNASRFYPGPDDHRYQYVDEDVHILMKVETHNHPTAISPYAGAATGAGGEIRDESATGTGGKPKAGLTGFTVSNLKIPEMIQPWEIDHGKPDRIVSALDIMIEGPVGAASYNNEYGRPALCGYFRTFEYSMNGCKSIYGYHKPIMLAGGYGMIRPAHVEKKPIPAGARIVVLGGPAMLIGLGGGAASSMTSGQSQAELDFASVQRDNAEMERRCQEVIDRCHALLDKNPIISIHDVGAGGLSNALPELINDSNRGATFELRDIPSMDAGMSPMEIWCNEAQERYVLAILPESLDLFSLICARERAPFAIIGTANDSRQLVLNDHINNTRPIDIPLPVLLGKTPRMSRSVEHSDNSPVAFVTDGIQLDEALERVLLHPAVADKRFLITIGDRTISGLVVRDQMVGPWQTPVADCAITCSSFDSYVGEAMAVGERSPVALINPPASGRLAIAEAITNICAARVIKIEDIVLSANWMAACGQDDEDAALYETVRAVSRLARELNIPIPVGKDSLSMSTIWKQDGVDKQVRSPVSLNISAFGPVADIRRSLTPQLRDDIDTTLLLIDLGNGANRLGGSTLAQVYGSTGQATADLDDAGHLSAFFQSIQLLNDTGLLLAYHDRSDGGLISCLCEMAFAGRTGIDISLSINHEELLAYLFNEEPGAVIQVRNEHVKQVIRTCQDAGLHEEMIHQLGKPGTSMELVIANSNEIIYSKKIMELHRTWSLTTFHMQALRDNPECAGEEYDQFLDEKDPGLTLSINEKSLNDPGSVMVNINAKPRIAILREQGVNGQVEMAAAFERAGFDCIDVHMTDILSGSFSLSAVRALVACGGFSYGDVLGAGGGWAKTILFNDNVRNEFDNFFHRKDTIGLGVCNGCQMMSHLSDLIPGAQHWPDFIRNRSEQFEARFSMVEILESKSIFLQGMEGSRLPVAIAHGEGRVHFAGTEDVALANPVLRFTDNYGNVTDRYPANPNGSPHGMTGFCNDDGRFTIMMPHPERLFLKKQYSWIADDWPHEDGPWMQLFSNARRWLEQV